MKEIELLPQWYRINKKQHNALRFQYAALGVILLLMTVWTLLINASAKRGQQELSSLEERRASTDKIIKEYSDLARQVEQLKLKKALIEQVSSNIDISSLLAELSFLIDKNVLIDKLSFTAEKFVKTRNKPQINQNAVMSQAEVQTLSGPVRFVIRMAGFAADSQKVADLICRLEDSQYFCQVAPLYTDNKNPRNKNIFSGNQSQIAGFDIDCYLANYEEKTGDRQ